MLTTFAEDFRNRPLSHQKARFTEIIQEIRVTRDRTVEVRFRDRPLGG